MSCSNMLARSALTTLVNLVRRTMSKSKARDKHGRFTGPWKLPTKRLILLGLVLTILPSAAVIMFNHGHPAVTPTSPSKITISTSHSRNASSTLSNGTPTPPPGSTVTLVHGRAYSTKFLAQTIEFEGAVTMYITINYDQNSVNYQQYSVYLPTGSYGVQLSQNSTPSDTRPGCTAFNGSVSPFVVNGASDQVQDFVCA